MTHKHAQSQTHTHTHAVTHSESHTQLADKMKVQYLYCEVNGDYYYHKEQIKLFLWGKFESRHCRIPAKQKKSLFGVVMLFIMQ